METPGFFLLFTGHLYTFVKPEGTDMTKLMYAAVIFSIVGQAARADDVGDFTFWNGVSTFGATFEGGYQIAPEYRLRGAWMGGLSLDQSAEDGGNTYEVDGALGAVSLILDYTPIQADWRLSGGVVFSRTYVDVIAQGSAGDPIEFDGETFDSGIATGRADFARQAAPIVTAGYDFPLSDRWVLSGEVGAVFVGGVALELVGNSQALQDALERDDEVISAKQDAADFTAYPYISISVGYKF